MIAKDSAAVAGPAAAAAPPDSMPPVPPGLSPVAATRRVIMPRGHAFDLLVVPSAEDSGAPAAEVEPAQVWTAAGTPAPVTIPLYGCYVIWAPGRGAVLAPAARLEQLAAALTEFATLEAELRDLERRGESLLATVEADASAAFEFDERSLGRRADLAERFRESVAVRRGMAALGPAVHVPPVHPPTLVSQLAERLRDRTRLAERHELATERADFAFEIYEACGQRAAEFTIARRQMGLEWAIIVILIAQFALMLVDLLASRSGT